MKTIIRNAIKTPDGTVLESRHRHDFVTHTDTVNGKEYMVDGGLSYLRRALINSDGYAAQDLTVYLEDGHAIVREALEWGTYGKNGDEPYRRVKLSEMTNAHIQACLDTQPQMADGFRTAMNNELEYRTENNILIED